MSGIERKRLKEVEEELASIATRRSGPFKSRDIDWRVISEQLRNLQIALEDENRTSFNQAFQMLRSRLAEPNKLRGKIHSWDKSHSMPPRVAELLNRVVDQIHIELTTPMPEAPKARSEVELAAEDGPERQS